MKNRRVCLRYGKSICQKADPFIFNIELERKIYAKRNKGICNRNFGKYL